MAKLARKNFKLFGSNSGANQIGVFGSLAAAAPAYSTDPEVIQSLSNYLSGWYAAVVGSNSPAIQDVNALFYVLAYNIFYMFQEGIPEWNTSTTYYIGSRVNYNNLIYVSVIDTNLGNTPSLVNQTNWALEGGRQRTITSSQSYLSTDNLVRCTHTGGSINYTLPAVAVVPIGWRVTVKNRSSDGSAVSVVGTIDGGTNYTLNSSTTYESGTFVNNGTDFDLI